MARDAQRAYIDELPHPVMYQPSDTGGLLMRSKWADAASVRRLRDAAKSVDANVVVTVNTMVDIVLNHTRILDAKITAMLSGLLGVLALALSVLGILGVVAYAVSQRTREIGVRRAIGAQRGDVFRMVVAQSMRPMVAGVVLGLFGGALATHAVRNMIVGVPPLDSLAYVTAATIVCGAAFIA